MEVAVVIIVSLAVGLVIWAGRALLALKRRRYLAAFSVPDAILKRFIAKRPELSSAQRLLAESGLRQYFQICQESRGKFVSMPSQVVDDLWHEFILFTRNYELFCQKAFGRYLHHTPVEAMASATQATNGIRRTWRHACRLEQINPRKPQRLPLLFALDAELGIADGFSYSLNCRDTALSSSNAFCASDIGCGSGTSCGGDGGGHGHGCGGGHGCGSGCGGGCGGS